MQTTAEVSRKYYVLTNLSARTHRNKFVYSLKCLPRTYLCICVYLLKRVHCIHFIAVVINEPQRAALPVQVLGGCGGVVKNKGAVS